VLFDGSGLQHPNIVPLKGFCTDPCTIITEYIESGSLYDFVLKEGKHKDANIPYTWPLRLKIAKDIAKGCAFLHSASPPVIHRDLKSPNILVPSPTRPKCFFSDVCCPLGPASCHHRSALPSPPTWSVTVVRAER